MKEQWQPLGFRKSPASKSLKAYARQMNRKRVVRNWYGASNNIGHRYGAFVSRERCPRCGSKHTKFLHRNSFVGKDIWKCMLKRCFIEFSVNHVANRHILCLYCSGQQMTCHHRCNGRGWMRV